MLMTERWWQSMCVTLKKKKLPYAEQFKIFNQILTFWKLKNTQMSHWNAHLLMVNSKSNPTQIEAKSYISQCQFFQICVFEKLVPPKGLRYYQSKVALAGL